VLSHSLTAQDDAGSAQQEASGYLVPTLQQQHRAAQAICVWSKAGDVINRPLNPHGAVARGRRNHDAHRRIGNWPVAAGVATVRKIRDAVATLVRVIDQTGVATDGNEGRLRPGRGLDWAD